MVDMRIECNHFVLTEEFQFSLSRIPVDITKLLIIERKQLIDYAGRPRNEGWAVDNLTATLSGSKFWCDFHAQIDQILFLI